METINLKPKQLKFANAILEGKTQREAFEVAGYKGNSVEYIDVQSHRLISNDKVNRYITIKKLELQKRLENETLVTKKEWIEELKTVGFAKITDFGTIDENGFTPKHSDNIAQDKIGAIAGVESTVQRIDRGEGQPELINSKIKLTFHKKLDALRQIGEAFGWINAALPPANNVQVNIQIVNR